MDSCPNCGTYIENDDKFCGQCRFELTVQKIAPQLTNQEINVNEVRTNLAYVYYKMGEYKKALEIFRKNLELNSNDENAKQMINQIEIDQKKI